MIGLTNRQESILRFIAAECRKGLPPTMREIGKHTGIRSTNGVNDHLRALERKGYLNERDLSCRTRNLSLTQLGWAYVDGLPEPAAPPLPAPDLASKNTVYLIQMARRVLRCA